MHYGFGKGLGGYAAPGFAVAEGGAAGPGWAVGEGGGAAAPWGKGGFAPGFGGGWPATKAAGFNKAIPAASGKISPWGI